MSPHKIAKLYYILLFSKPNRFNIFKDVLERNYAIFMESMKFGHDHDTSIDSVKKMKL